MPSTQTNPELKRSRRWEKLLNDLRQAIHAGDLKPGQALLSYRELGDRYGISATSVRRALNGLVSEGLVEQRARTGTFVRKASLTEPETTGHGRLARTVFYLPHKGYQQLDPYYTQVVFEIESTLRAGGWDMIFWPLREMAEAKTLFSLQGDRRPEAGQILIGPIDRFAADAYETGQVPRVFVDHRPEVCSVDVVLSDDAGGMHRGVECLLDLGHKRIAYVGGSDCDGSGPRGRPWPNSIRREATWRQALQHADIEVSESWSILTPSIRRGGRQAFEQLAALRPRPTAVIAFTPGQAIGLVESAREAGVRVPEDLSVLAFGLVDDEVPNLNFEPALLTPDARALGRNGAELLMRRIAQPDGPLREVLVPFELHRGETLASAPKK